MAKTLVIVESPTKARTIKSILKSSKYIVKASKGHIRDLPKSKIGVDIENNFEPSYITIRGKGDVISTLKESVKKADQVILATDPDREGEAISWHLAELLRLNKSEPLRVEFHEITTEAVKKAFANPRHIDTNLVNAQQARRVLDRIVGYKLSPLLWKKVSRGLSAGRVQSVAVKLIVDREKERDEFKSEEYWSIDAKFNDTEDKEFWASLNKIEGKKVSKLSAKDAENIIAEVKNKVGNVQDITESERKRNPYPPFITSTLQQEAARRYKFPARRTMLIAQQLYEGIKIGKSSTGLITYMRTDSVQLSSEAMDSSHRYILNNFGDIYYQKRFFKNKKNSQGAHEAIRPTDVNLTPDSIKESLSADQYKVYKLIWNRFISSQMASAVYAVKNANILVENYNFRVTGSKLVFNGFLKVYSDEKEEKDKEFPSLELYSKLPVIDINGKQHFTEPPPRFTEATLIKELEDKGIGRPSTYAPILDTIVKRRYIEKEKGRLAPTSLAKGVNGLLEEYFTTIINIEFTANMEDDLDKVASGQVDWHQAVNKFYGTFAEQLSTAEEKAERVKIEKKIEITDIICEKCGKNMVIREGRYGKFLACSGFPDCKNTQPILNKIGVACAKCGGDLVQKKSKRGKIFYGCSNYPDCDYVSWDKPIKQLCPECASNLVEKQKKDGSVLIKCSNTECSYQEVKSQ